MYRLFLVYVVLVALLWMPFAGQLYAQNTTQSFHLDPEIEKYNQLISRYRYDKPDSALVLVYKGLEYARAHRDKQGEAVLLNQLGMINDNRGKYEDARLNYNEALDIYRLLGFDKGIATEIIRLGVVELRKGNYDRAVDYFLQALKVSDGIHDAKGIMEANITLGEAYMAQHRYQLSLRYLITAKNINDTIPFSNLSLNLYNDFGVAYTATNDLADAKAYLNIGISKSALPQYQGLNITLTNNLALVYAKEGDTAICIKLQKSALGKAQSIHNFLRELQTLTGLANIYKTQNADTCLKYLFKAKALAESKNAYKQVNEALQQIAVIYAQKHDYKSALAAKSEQYDIADKHFYKEMSKQVASLEANYELSKSKVKVQQLSLINNRQKFERRIILAIALAAIMIMLITSWFYYRTRSLNKLLSKTNQDLDASNHTKDKLFSILGHDLRTPFVSVMNLLAFIDDEDLPDESRRELIAQLSLTANASLETLDRLLKWGEMQIKGVRLHQTEFAVKPVVDRVKDMLQNTANNKSIELISNLTPDIKVYADINHFEFVMRNLISNAIKFTGTNGRVVVRAEIYTLNSTVKIIVEDNGVGIVPEKMQEIFSAANISSNGTHDEKGTSLGLLMCKEFMQINSGRIYAESEAGKGSRFITEFHHHSSTGHKRRHRLRLRIFRSAQVV